MDPETRRFEFTETFDSLPLPLPLPLPGSSYSSFSSRKPVSETSPVGELDTTGLIDSILQDDKENFLSHAKSLFAGDLNDRRSSASMLLTLCCANDSLNCAASLLNGEIVCGGGAAVVPFVNEIDGTSGMAPLHEAAGAHAARCVALLLRKRARTDLRSKDGRALLPLELSLCSSRMDLIWNPDDYTIEDLVALLSEKDLTVIKLLAEKTKELEAVAYASAIGGRIMSLATLLMIAPNKISKAILVIHDVDMVSKHKTTIYECVIKEALTLSHANQSLPNDCTLKRKLLLCEIELLQLFGAVAYSNCADKKQTSILISAIQAGDEAVVELLLRANIDVNETDAEGNPALHCCLKTLSVSHAQQTRIMCLLLDHGARVTQRNKLGLTALHFAAANGNSEAAEILILENPDSVNSKTEIKETPLFFAVKNDHLDCVELLLRWGANTEVRNLRKQRPVEVAESQDMRYMLNPTNISRTSHVTPEEHVQLSVNELWSQRCHPPSKKKEEETDSRRNCSTTKFGTCKFFESPTGCVRGSKCFYAHGEEELRQKQAAYTLHSPTKDFREKVFVGGLPPSLDSLSLAKIFEEQFGSVKEARVTGVQTGDHIKSRGFGFVTFKHEESVSEAIKARYVDVIGGRVEIKSALHKFALEELQKLQLRRYEEEKGDRFQTQAQTPDEKITPSVLSLAIKQDPNSQNPSCTDGLLPDQPTMSSPTSQAQGFADKPAPAWLKKFTTWFPRFLHEVSKRARDVEYPLSSLKGDFRAIFGMELDHASLGYQKLSDFIKCFPNLCQMKVVPIGRTGPATHWVLLPCRSKGKLLQPSSISRSLSQIMSIDDNTDNIRSDSKFPEDLTAISSPNFVSTGNNNKNGSISEKVCGDNLTPLANKTSPQEDISPTTCSKFLDLSEQESLVSAQSSSYTSNKKYLPMHPVLETLAKKRNNASVFFLREFDFYHNYNESVRQGKCFWCSETKLLWANFPCRHKLWCISCKQEAAKAAGDFEHKCVVCDAKVQRFILMPPNGFNRPNLAALQNDEEFPAYSPSNLRNFLKKKAVSFDSESRVQKLESFVR